MKQLFGIALLALFFCQSSLAQTLDVAATEKAVGISLKLLTPFGLYSDAATEISGTGSAQFQKPVTQPRPTESFTLNRTLIDSGKNGDVFEAVCASPAMVSDSSATAFEKKFGTKRRDYGSFLGRQFQSMCIYIRARTQVSDLTALYFPDCGTQTTAPHAFVLDQNGDAHLAICDVDGTNENAFTLYWLRGNISEACWKSVAIVDYRANFTRESKSKLVKTSRGVLLFWSWSEGGANTAESGVYCLAWNENGFGIKQRLVAGTVEHWDVASDESSGEVLFAYSRDGFHARKRGRNDGWFQEFQLLGSEATTLPLSVHSSVDGFVVKVGTSDDTAKFDWKIEPEVRPIKLSEE